MATSLLQPRKNKWIFAACWTLWGIMQFVVLQDFDLPWKASLIDSLVSNVFLAGVTMLVITSLAYYRPEKRKYVYLLGVCTVLSIIWGAIICYGLPALEPEEFHYERVISLSLPIRFSIAFLITGCSAITSMLWYNLQEQKHSESRKSDAERMSRDAELYKLRAQLQPHFLFNSLNSISALAGKQPEQARKMIQQLSEFLRGALKKEDHQMVTLEEELSHLQLYLDMEKMRFGHRLSTEIAAEDDAMGFLLPPMLLQPLVENAIKFGLYDTTDDITIAIRATIKIEFLEITVTNPFDPETSTPRHGTGFGLTSVQRRLYLLFARNDLLTTNVNNHLFSTTVKIPKYDTDAVDR